MPNLLISVLAISCKDLFFLSITPFCWGVLDKKNYGRYLFHQIRFQWKHFQVLLHDHSLQRQFSNLSFWTFLQNFLNASKVSSLWERNKTHMNLEKSLTITNPYLFPPMLSILVGPNKSACSSSRILSEVTAFLGWKLDLVCLPLTQTSHTLSFSNLMFDKPLTRLCLNNLDKVFMLSWPTLLCHTHLSLSKATKQD